MKKIFFVLILTNMFYQSCNKKENVIDETNISSITIVSGNAQEGLRGYTLPEKLSVVITDEFEEPISNVKVAFDANKGGSAYISPVYTDENGIASCNWKLGKALGEQKVLVSVYEGNHLIEFEEDSIQFHAIATDSLIDTRDNNRYKIVDIGYQTWFAQNLNYDTIDSYYYDDNPSYASKYGKLYSWETACKACPDGWHLPSDEEWDELEDYLGGWLLEAGGKMKEEGTENWKSPNEGATNESGFTALPSGVSYSIGNYQSIGEYTVFWSSTPTKLAEGNNKEEGFDRGLRYLNSGTSHTFGSRSAYYSVRCIKD